MTDKDKLIATLWQLANVRGYVCPLFQAHPRAFLFPNKELWEMHMNDHTDSELNCSHNIRMDYDEYIEILKHADKIEEELIEDKPKEPIPHLVQDGDQYLVPKE